MSLSFSNILSHTFINEKWFVLGFLLLLAFILLGVLSDKLGRNDKSNSLETDN